MNVDVAFHHPIYRLSTRYPRASTSIDVLANIMTKALPVRASTALLQASNQLVGP